MKSRTRVKTVVSLVTLGVLVLVVVPAALGLSFNDVPPGHWAYVAIDRISNLHITVGCGGGNYCPDQNVSRAQMAGFMNNLTKAYTTVAEPYIISLDHQYIYGEYPALAARSYAGPGVYASSYGGYEADNAVYASTNSTDPNKAGVYGASSDAAAGVMGWSDYGHGVYGYTGSSSSIGVVGSKAGASGWTGDFYAPGVWGSGQNGVLGTTNVSGAGGIAGETTSSSGWCGYFYTTMGNGVTIYTPSNKVGLVVYGGTKSAAVDTDEGSRLLYTEEATEVWFADYGFAQLQDGAALVAIDPLFAQTVNLSEPYHVFVQAYGDAELYVKNRTATGFEVMLREGDPNVEFSYRLVAKRLGYEDDRLEQAPQGGRQTAGQGQE